MKSAKEKWKLPWKDDRGSQQIFNLIGLCFNYLFISYSWTGPSAVWHCQEVSGSYSLDNTRSNTPMHCNSKQETMVGRLAEILTAKDDKSKEIFNLKWRKKCVFFPKKELHSLCYYSKPSSNVIPLSAVCNGWVFPFLIHNPHTYTQTSWYDPFMFPHWYSLLSEFAVEYTT